MTQKMTLGMAAAGITLSAAMATFAWVVTQPDGSQGFAPGCDPICVIAPQHATLPAIGDSVDETAVHLIRHPGRYGLSTPPDGSHYAILEGRIVRISSSDGQLLSVLRLTEHILD